ncbi:TetR/AcrR family transcriptional regulator C-terminal domain-containing protein [Nocardia inohanensis]|uniref:TetR/AcrR family transcriptional regulator C-terminal domain-containing protein n=1 Tax=Nocardia inohanensis TaxID=209246 RepID=UPI00082AB197|nr:TetR/AcrR family transcriptional regulator C-terminal domain-containing protein [Nocardia inohanensis]
MPRKSKSLDEATPEAIARAGLAIISEKGGSELSFRAIANYLEVSHTTVVRRGGGDFAGLLDLLADHLADSLPVIPAGSGEWAELTERRFTALYELLGTRPGLVLLRGSRSWFGPRILSRLTEPQLADNLALGLTVDDALLAYREMYLYTLGCAALIEHRDRKTVRLRTRSALAALDPEEFPVLGTHLETVAQLTVSDDIFCDGLRRLITSWAAAPKS